MARPKKSVAGYLGPADRDLGLFDRSVATWKRLGAPADLYDAEKAAEKSAGMAPSLESLEHEEGIDRASLHHLLARRYWQWSRPEFLAAAGALTSDELARLERFPKLHKHTKENR